MRILPISVNNPKCNVFVWRPCSKVKKNRVVVARFFYNFVRRGLGLIDEVRVENIELMWKAPLQYLKKGQERGIPCNLAQPSGVDYRY